MKILVISAILAIMCIATPAYGYYFGFTHANQTKPPAMFTPVYSDGTLEAVVTMVREEGHTAPTTTVTTVATTTATTEDAHIAELKRLIEQLTELIRILKEQQ